MLRYLTYDSDGILLETNNSPVESPFTVEDNRTTEADVAVTLYEADEYMKDHYALYAIWKALHGEEWSYQGENYPIGSNWDFNKDPDLWSYQPGVEVHTNGRVAKIDLSGFGFYGDMPKEIGQLTELVELYLGTHNDVTQGFEDPTLDPNQSIAERTRNRLENHKKYLHLLHPAQQMSWPCAFALREHNIHIRATELYDQGYTEDEIFEAATGRQRDIRPLDTSHGKLCNGLKSLPAEIGNLKKLEYLYIANSAIESLPDYEGEGKEGMQGLESCTDFEVYNCPKMEKFPIAITKMPRLVAANLSNNRQWQAQDLHDGLKALAEGPSKEYIQLLYLVNNSLEELPAEFRNMKRLSMLDLTQNRLRVLHPLGSEVALVQLFLDNNQLEEIPTDENGIFCNIADMTDLSASYNKLRKFPNIFKEAKSAIANIDLSYNQITNFTEEETAAFHGVFVETLTLTGNTGITKFPKWLADSESQVAYIILRGCGITEIPEGSFKGKYSNQFVAGPDLQPVVETARRVQRPPAAQPLRTGHLAERLLEIPHRSADLQGPDHPRHPRSARRRRRTLPAGVAHGALQPCGTARLLHRLERPAQDRRHDLDGDLDARHQRQPQHHVRCVGRMQRLAERSLRAHLRQDAEYRQLRRDA